MKGRRSGRWQGGAVRGEERRGAGGPLRGAGAGAAARRGGEPREERHGAGGPPGGVAVVLVEPARRTHWEKGLASESSEKGKEERGRKGGKSSGKGSRI